MSTSCFYSNEEKELVKKYEEQAKINAVKYVKSKYGYDAKVISAKAAKNTNSISPIPNYTPTGYVYVKLKVNKKEFYVYITGEQESIDGKDNYQQDEIEKDLLELLKTNIGISPYNYSVEYPNSTIYNNTENSNLIKEYYNKNNLSDVLQYIKKI